MVEKRRIGELDAFRGLAALAVLLFHYTTFYEQSFGHEESYLFEFPKGFYGVQLFFMISGFVIYMTVIRCKDIKEFAVKRAIRLYPAYIIAVILTFIITSNYNPLDLSVSLTDFFVNLTMFQTVIPGLSFQLVDGSYWSLAIELTFYIICGILLISNLIKKPILTASVWLVSVYLIKFLYLKDNISPIIGDLGIVNYSNLFILGIIFYHLQKQLNNMFLHILILFSWMYQFIYQGIESGIFVAFFILLFYGLIYGKLSFLNNRVLTFFGTISYSLYLIHQNIGNIIIHILEKNGFTHTLYVLIPILISISLASFITYFIEKPIQKFLLDKYRLKNSTRTTNDLLIFNQGNRKSTN